MPAWFVDGLAEHVARQLTVPLFEKISLPGGYAVLEQRVFGRLVPRALSIRMEASRDGEPLEAYRRNLTVQPVGQPGSIADARSLEAKTVFALATMEQWLGRPVFDQVVSEFSRRTRDRMSPTSGGLSPSPRTRAVESRGFSIKRSVRPPCSTCPSRD